MLCAPEGGSRSVYKMNSEMRQKIAFSPHASVALFECLIVAGAPATGLLQNEVVSKHRPTLQKSLELLRDMWTRSDALHVCQDDLISLHRMECESAGHAGAKVPKCIAVDHRKLSRYYVYLLFRYSVSFASSDRGGFIYNRFRAWGAGAGAVEPLRDIPHAWLPPFQSPAPSAPPEESDFAQLSRAGKLRAQTRGPGRHAERVDPSEAVESGWREADESRFDRTERGRVPVRNGCRSSAKEFSSTRHGQGREVKQGGRGYREDSDRDSTVDSGREC
uniref:Uncharacterized protein n=1 Tax=Oryzias latipes TaxID=8090 RepID=A0A286P9R4_ORYLA|nr:hypothetical protein [Oryzias latipes]